jgi:hypothetical protein
MNPGASGAPGVSGSPLPAEEIVSICDDLLGEVGRRNHLFSWLRSGPGEWLPVDAYYPAHRLVVVYERRSELYGQLVPARGLQLLELDRDQLPKERAGAQAMLERRLGGLAPVAEPPRPTPQRERSPRESPVAQAVAAIVQPVVPPLPVRRPSESRAAAAARATRRLRARRELERPLPSLPPRIPRPRPEPVIPGPRTSERRGGLGAPSLLLGAALAAALTVETYLAIAAIAVDRGQVLLAAGIVLDGCSRALGTVAATKLGQHGWAWACLAIGSPAVAAFTLFRTGGPVTVDPGPLGGLLALVAMGAVALGVVVWVL